MKIVITGSLGNIGKPLTEELVWKGHDVTVITCFPNHPTGIIPDAYKHKRFLIEKINKQLLIN